MKVTQWGQPIRTQSNVTDAKKAKTRVTKLNKDWILVCLINGKKMEWAFLTNLGGQ